MPVACGADVAVKKDQFIIGTFGWSPFDGLVVVDYATGSIKNTQLSYNDNGNYFNFDMSILEPEYEYEFKFATYEDYRQTYVEQPYAFKFKVSEWVYKIYLKSRIVIL